MSNQTRTARQVVRTSDGVERIVSRHHGDPLIRLEQVRREHNIVTAVPDVLAARKLIVDLERAGVDPDNISLLGAWPVSANPVGPWHQVRRAILGAAMGASAAFLFARMARPDSTLLAPFSAVTGAVIGSMLGAATAFGMSDAWTRTFSADGAGTVAVGAHSDDVYQVQRATAVMGRHPGAVAVNQFNGSSRSR